MDEQNQTKHYSVLLHETINSLLIDPNGIYLDCTLGGGGHSEEILKRLCQKEGRGKLICIDRDAYALEKASKRLEAFGDKKILCEGNFADSVSLLSNLGIYKIDGVVADLGVSSFQLDNAERGFSYMQDAILDMRMRQGEGQSAFEVINQYSEEELKKMIWEYGEERFAGRIASAIVRERQISPIERTVQLSEIIKNAIPAKNRKGGPHPAKRTFQAIRIEVNKELEIISPFISDIFPILNESGRMAFISFHSLEDRLIKHSFLSFAKGCVCPAEFPICVCDKLPRAKIITRKPILPSESELLENPRSRSAKLRVMEKIRD